MKEIPIRYHGEIVDFAIVDDDDYELVSQYSWTLHTMGYAQSAKRINGKSVKFFMHRLILDAPPKQKIDHVDGRKLNNTRSNLRYATTSQNAMNKKPSASSTSKYKGVSYQSNRAKWLAMLEHEGKSYFLGRFNDEEEAARAYDRKALELFGEYAYLNFPREDYINEFRTSNRSIERW